MIKSLNLVVKLNLKTSFGVLSERLDAPQLARGESAQVLELHVVSVPFHEVRHIGEGDIGEFLNHLVYRAVAPLLSLCLNLVNLGSNMGERRHLLGLSLNGLLGHPGRVIGPTIGLSTVSRLNIRQCKAILFLRQLFQDYAPFMP